MMRRVCLLLLTAAVLGSCTDDKKKTSDDPRFASIWPHEDGLSWVYDYVVEQYPGFSLHMFDDPDDIPHLPPMSVLASYLDELIPENGDVEYGFYELLFDGTITTLYGVEAQRLQESIYELGHTFPVSPAPGAERPTRRGFWEQLAQARPELAGSGPQEAPGPAQVLDPPTLLAGGAWEQNSSWIGDYSDAQADVAWIYLTTDLEPGDGFTLQLVPQLADDVYLDAVVLDWVDVETPLGDLFNCVQVLYRVDFGVGEALAPGGQSLGYTRAMTYGVVIYAPDIGPVYALERDLCNALDPFDCAREIETSILAQVFR